MWLVRKSSGEPVYFQCAVLPLEDYPMSSRSITFDASALPGSSQAPALEAQAAATGVNTLLDDDAAALAEEEKEVGVVEKVPAGAAVGHQGAALPLPASSAGAGEGAAVTE